MQNIVDRIVLIQLVLSSVIAVVLWFLFDLKISYSAFLGGSLCGIGTFIVAKIMFCFRGLTPAQMVWALFLGEFAKIVFTVVVFYVAFFLLGLNIAAFILTYIIVLMPTWLVSLIIQ